MPGKDLWTDGLLCAFELVKTDIRGKKSDFCFKNGGTHVDDSLTTFHDDNFFASSEYTDFKKSDSFLHSHKDSRTGFYNCLHNNEIHGNGSWVAIGWARISELVQQVHTCSRQDSHQFEFIDNNELTVSEMAGPCLEKREGPTWWCHVSPVHPSINTWLNNASWLHPAISVALRDEGKLISDKMKHLLYEVPVRVDGGLLFELLGQSVGDPGEGDTPVVLRSWQSNNFLLTALHVKGSLTDINVLGILEVQESISYGNHNAPRTIHELIALLVVRLTLWDDRLFRKHIFGEADEIELKFMNRRNHEDMNLFSVLLNQEIRKLSRQVIRVKWSLHAREEIVFELMQYLRGNAAKIMLHDVRNRTREMINEQEAVRGRLFTIQDVIQSTVRSWLQDRSLRVTHNLTVFGGCGLVLSIVTGLFGINVDGIPGSERTPYAFLLFTALLFGIGAVLIGVGLVYLGLKKPVDEEEVEVRKVELQDLVKMFQHEAETHTSLRTPLSVNNFSSSPPPDYLIIQ